MIILTCPNCAANLEIDQSREFAFCQYCGTKIANLNNRVEVNRAPEVNNLLVRALEFERVGDFQRCAEYCTRILDMDPYNETARQIEMRLPNHSAGPNVKIIYRSERRGDDKLRVSLDCRSWSTLSKDGTLQLELPEGKHKIYFSGSKSYTHEVSVHKNRKITITYTAEKWKNTIEESSSRI